MVADTIMPTGISSLWYSKEVKFIQFKTAQLWNTLLLLYLNYEAAGQHGYEEALGLVAWDKVLL